TLEPLEIVRRDPILVLEDPPDPYRRRHVVLGYADTLPDKVPRLPDPGIVAHEDRRVAEREGREHRDGDQGLAAGSQHGVGAQGELRHVEVPMPRHSIEHLFRLEGHHPEFYAVRSHRTGAEGERAVIVATSERERQRGHWSS